MQPPPKKLLDQVRDAIRLKHYAYRTEETYVQWIRRYILFHNKRHPKAMGNAASEAFLTHLAVEGHVSASTQNQALSALLFLYREVLNLEIAGIDAVRAKRPQDVPTVCPPQKRQGSKRDTKMWQGDRLGELPHGAEVPHGMGLSATKKASKGRCTTPFEAFYVQI